VPVVKNVVKPKPGVIEDKDLDVEDKKKKDYLDDLENNLKEAFAKIHKQKANLKIKAAEAKKGTKLSKDEKEKESNDAADEAQRAVEEQELKEAKATLENSDSAGEASKESLEDQEPPKPKKHHKHHDLTQVKHVLKKIRNEFKAPEIKEEDRIDGKLKDTTSQLTNSAEKA
jgi:hypothetical protein